MFGSNNKPSLFGNSTTNTGGFGSTGFGQNTTQTGFGMGQPQQQQQTSLFGGQTNTGFGSSNTSGGLFGQPQQQSTGLFGSSNTTQTQSTGFGAQPSSSGFGTGGSLFSNNNNNSNTTNNTTQSIFGAPKFGSNTTTPFGSSSGSTLGGGIGGQPVVGTTVKFSPLIGTDTMVKNGVNQSINTRHQCITCMKEYENKSLEELRFEDYQANRKGPQNSMFGASTTSQPSGGLFSSNTSTPSVSFNTNNTGGSLFGAPKPAFGAPTTTTSTTSIFGNSAFGANKPFGASTPAFGATAQTAQPVSTPATGSLFGANTSTTSAFGQQNNMFAMNNNNAANTQTQNKPFFTATTNSQPSLFSNTATTNTLAAKPLFGTTTPGQTNAFGTVPTTNTGFSFAAPNTTSQPSAIGGGLFANAQTTSLFNTNTAANNTAAAKPLFNFSTPSTGLGTTTNPLGTNTSAGSSLFNTGASLGTNTLGANTSMFNTGNTGSSLFGNNTGLSTGGLGTNTLGQNNMLQMQPLQANQTLSAPAAVPASNSSDHLMTRLLVLPYGTSPLFQNQTQSSSSSGGLKFTTDPKTLNQYKVNFSTNTSSNSGKSVRVPNSVNRNTSLLFEDYEDITQNEKKTAADIFVPRKSIKKLIIKPKEDLEKTLAGNNTTTTNLTSLAPVTQEKQTLDLTSSAAPEKTNQLDTTVMEFYRKGQSNADTICKNIVTSSPVISNATNKPSAAFTPIISSTTSPEPVKSSNNASLALSPQQSSNDLSGNYSQNYSLIGPSEIGSPSAQYVASSPTKQYKCRVISTRPNYFTIPSLEELDTLVDEQEQVCIVENFTVGRQDYGTIFWDGPLNVYGLNIDEIVHIRRKEVIVYPDDSDKAPLGTGLNRPAQITLHKVWPVDKATRDLIKDPQRLEKMGYEEKIEMATIKFGGIFKEYRAETGSWVFCVKHFSKYGLLDDDDDEEPGQMQIEQTSYQAQQPATRAGTFESQPLYLDSKSTNAFKKPTSFRQDSSNFQTSNEDSQRQSLGFWNNNKSNKQRLDSFSYEEEENRYVGSFRPPTSNVRNNFFDEPDEEDDEALEKNSSAQISDCLVDPIDTGYFASLRNALFDEPKDEKPIVPSAKKSKKLLLIPDSFAKAKEVESSTQTYSTVSRFVPVKLNLVVKRDLPFDDLPALNYDQAGYPSNDIGSIKFAPFPKVRFFAGGNRLLLIKGRHVQVLSVQLLDSFDAQSINRFEHQLNENSIVSSCDLVSAYVQTKPTIANPFNNEQLEKLIKALYCRLDIRDESSYDMTRTNLVLDWLCEQNLSLPKPNETYALIIHYLAGNDLRSAIDVAARSRHPKLLMLLTCGNMLDFKTNIQQQLTNWRTNQMDRFIDFELLRVYVLLSGETRYRISSGEEIDVLDGLQWTQQLSLLLLYSIHEGLQSCVERLTCETDDVEYHLIAGNSPLIAMSATRNDLEAWFLHQSLKSYGVIDVSVNSNVAHGLLAGQLLSVANGIRWACFVATHINDDLLRDYTIRELLLLQIANLTRSDEQWLQTQLLLPKHFIAEAKATYAKSRFQNAEYALKLLDCKNWSEAHEVLIESILPELVINEENDKLRELIDQLKPYKSQIAGWYPSGAHIYDLYCQCVKDEYYDEQLCSEPFDINQMKTNSVRQVLCKSEMARNFNLIYHGKTGDRYILNMPVPNDYAKSEVKSNFWALLKSWS